MVSLLLALLVINELCVGPTTTPACLPARFWERTVFILTFWKPKYRTSGFLLEMTWVPLSLDPTDVFRNSKWNEMERRVFAQLGWLYFDGWPRGCDEPVTWPWQVRFHSSPGCGAGQAVGRTAGTILKASWGCWSGFGTLITAQPDPLDCVRTTRSLPLTRQLSSLLGLERSLCYGKFQPYVKVGKIDKGIHYIVPSLGLLTQSFYFKNLMTINNRLLSRKMIYSETLMV